MLRSRRLFYGAILLTLFGLTFTTVYLLARRGGENPRDAEFLMARVKDIPITKLQFITTQNRMLMAKMSEEGVVRGTDTFNLRLQAFDSLVKDVLLKEWARAEGTLKGPLSDTAIQKLALKKIGRLKDRIASTYNTDNPDAYFEEFVKRAGFPNSQAFVEDAKMALLEQELAKHLFPDVPVGKGEVLNNLPVARARQIFMTFTAETRDQVYQKMQELLAQIQKTKVNTRERSDLFQKLASDHSEDDATRAKGGDLGFIREADVGDPVMLEQLKSLDQGEVSQVFTTGAGFHLLYVELRPQWNKKSTIYGQILKETEGLLRLQKQKQRFLAQFQERLANLVENGELEILDPLLKAQDEDRKGNMAQAQELYRQAEQLDPRNGYINLSLAEIAFRQNKFKEALEQYQKAIDKTPEDPYLYVRRAKYYLTVGKVDEAAVDLSIASNSAPLDFQLHLFLEKVYRQLTMLPEAEQEKQRYFAAIQKIYGNVEVYKNQERLKEQLLNQLGEEKPFMQTWEDDARGEAKP